jgi:CO/xanthine dehydrogenase FAD-binding subunit
LDPAVIHRARSVADARAARRDGAVFAAGLTALQLAWPDGRPDRPLADLTGLVDLRGVASDGPGVRLGALTDLETLRCDPLVRAKAPLVAELLPLVAGLEVRHLATLGGNLAWRAGDLVPLLLALGAVVETTGGAAPPHLLPEGELVLAVRVPPQPEIAMVEKVGFRAAFSPALVTVAASLSRDGPRLTRVRLALGGGPNPPQLLAEAAALLEDQGRLVDWGLLEETIAAEASCGTDALAPAAHRARVAAKLLTGHLRQRLA